MPPSALGPVFGSGLVGILFDSGLFGWVGDRYGRKVALISANIVFGVFTWLAPHSKKLEQMLWQRLLAGIGIGAVVPIVIAVAAIFGVPESLKFMVLHTSQRGRMERLVAELRPDLTVLPDA